MRRVVVVLTLGLFLATSSPAVTFAQEPPPADERASVPDQLLVGYRRGASAGQRAEARRTAGATVVERVVQEAPDRIEVELVSVRADARSEARRRFEANRNVVYAEPNYVVTHGATSNDPYYTNGSLWGMYGDASSPTNQYGSQAAEAWAGGNTGNSTVYIGIIDEGYQFTHPDLAANAGKNPGEVGTDGGGRNKETNGVDDDANGYVDDVRGWDFHSNDNTVYDGTSDDHGTHVAGTIGARGGNGAGVVGVAWNVSMLNAKFLGPRGGTIANAIKSVDYFTGLKAGGVNIVATNNSWGGGGYSQGLYDAIQRANGAGILFVAAAGNGGGDGVGDDNDANPHYPSSYPNDNIIAVASITSTGAKSGFSNYGANSVDLGAPGSGVWSTVPTDTYKSYSGTSMATPHVAGAAALYSAYTGVTGAAVKSAILSATIPTASLAGKTVTGGRLNAGGFFSTDATPPAAPAGLVATPGDGRVSLDWSDNSEADVAGYDVYRSTDNGVTYNKVNASLLTTSSYTDTGLTNGTTYSYFVKAVDQSGNQSGASVTVSATPEAVTMSLTATVIGKAKGLTSVELVWVGATGTDVDVLRNGSKLVTTANTGSYVDKVKGGGTFTYRVCEPGTTRCSNQSTVTF